MIHIRIMKDPKGSYRSLEISGHSGFAEAGSDIICAAVSLLAENLAGCMVGLLDKHPTVDKEYGSFRIRLSSKDADEASALLFASTIYGLRVLQNQYPERIAPLHHIEKEELSDSDNR